MNTFLALARKANIQTDTIKVFSDATQLEVFKTITSDDISGSGILRPIGARHFATVANTVGEMARLASTGLWKAVAPHISSYDLAELIIGNLIPDRHNVLQRNKAVEDQVDLQRAQSLAQQQLAAEESIDLGGMTNEI